MRKFVDAFAILIIIILTYQNCGVEDSSGIHVDSKKFSAERLSYFSDYLYDLDLQTGAITQNTILLGCLPATDLATVKSFFEQATFCRVLTGGASCLIGSSLNLMTSEGNISIYEKGNCAQGYYFCKEEDVNSLNGILDSLKNNYTSLPPCP
jgi:hypothetical protein